jgi:uncharacterized protein (TIGR03032 family)
MPTDTARLSDTPFRSANTPGFAPLLEGLGVTLLVTTYQAGKLMAVRAQSNRVSTLLRGFEHPMGLAIRAGEFALGTRCQVWFFRNAPDIGVQIPPAGAHDACFLPRVSHVTGDIRGHEMAWVGDELWIVNTFFSCLCTVDRDYCFVPRWHPPFLAAPAPGDHCHLNGLAVADGAARYVTALGATDTPAGWRPTKAEGGVLIDVPSGAIVSRGICMPHSPRLHDGRLWLLESGTGQLQTVDERTGKRDLVAQLPGFGRGLAFAGPYAFIGLSKIRETATFGSLPIAASGAQLQCGIWVVDLRTGQTAEFMQFQAGVEEIFAIEVLHGCRYPEIVGFQQETIRGAFVVPKESLTPKRPGTKRGRKRKKG